MERRANVPMTRTEEELGDGGGEEDGRRDGDGAHEKIGLVLLGWC